MRYVMGLMLLACLLTACGYNRRPDERTDDGLVRVASRADGGVYRLPGADFTPYKRIILEPPTIEFVDGWRRKHKEVTDKELTRLVISAVKTFREEFTRVVVDDGPYEYADAPGPDVLLLVPRIVDFDVPAPEAGNTSGVKQYTKEAVSMQVVGELRDAESNQLLGRVIVFEDQERRGVQGLQLANRVTNTHEMRLGFAKWSRIALEALYVAKAGQPLPDLPAADQPPQ